MKARPGHENNLNLCTCAYLFVRLAFISFATSLDLFVSLPHSSFFSFFLSRATAESIKFNLLMWVSVCLPLSVSYRKFVEEREGGEGAKDEGPRGGTRPCQWRRPVVLFKELLNMVKACAWVCECCLCMYVLNKYFGASFLDYILEQLQMGSTNTASIWG